ncbi:hypothetical protein Dda_0584 [Drechslerella dactyloides]|uniref:ENTH domain-containing protein n=1 Tax=Drechslerella dactyloides TaxID=74499 RepID=A0AAD6J4R9_DREDA|nr:hypothetical protein Dda_0584 [Drechslerella dactyloides]
MSRVTPNSATDGFFQEQPRLGNQYEEDIYLQRLIQGYLPTDLSRDSVAQDAPVALFRDIGSKTVRPEVFGWIEDAEKNRPYVEELSTFGKPKGVLHTAAGWKQLGAMAAREGIIQTAYEDRYASYARLVQFTKYYLYCPSSAIYTCPLAMTDAAARVLDLQLRSPSLAAAKRSVFQEAYSSLTSRDPAACWTSGQWMTERAGGSDVRNSETTAFPQPDGTYLVSGHKWFSSATDSQMTILLARTPTSTGSLSCFFAPLKLPDGSWNGVRIVRLKDKLGTKALPTAELELKGMKAHLVGEEGKGIKYISTMLNITRVHNAVRRVQNKELWRNPLHLGGLAKMEVLFRANMQLTFFTVALLGFEERGMPETRAAWMPKDAKETGLLLRVLTPLVKMVTAKATIAGLAECMECLGGVGYLENEQELNIARLYRDANVLTIWEGTTNVLSVDVIRAFTKGDSLAALDSWLTRALDARGVASLAEVRAALRSTWAGIRQFVDKVSSEEAIARCRDLSFSIAFVLMGAFLVLDADRDGDALAAEVAVRWALEGLGREGFQIVHGETAGYALGGGRGRGGWKERAEVDCGLVFGHGVYAGCVGGMFDGWPKQAKPASSDILSSSNCSARAGLLAAAAPIDLASFSPADSCFNRPLYHYLDALLAAHPPSTSSSLRPLIPAAAEAEDTMNFTLDDIKNQVTNLTLYDVKAAVRKAQNVVMNFTEMESKVREATNNEPWGASSTLMNEIAAGTFNYQQLNEIMPMIYKRFTEKSAEEWRQIYKALQLLEFLVKNGSERVVDDARQHISTVKMLKQFHFIDQNGKDQGLNVRNRAKELAELLSDVDKIRAERKKSKQSRGKYQGMEGGGGFGGMTGSYGGGGSGSGGGGSRYGGFGSDDLEYGGYSGGVYGDGGGFGGQSSGAYADSTRRPGQYEEYNEYDEGATAAPPPKKPARPEAQKAAAAPPPKKEPAVDLLFGDDPAPAATTAKAGGSKSAMDDDFGNFKTGNDDDDFDDFISAAPISPPASNANRAITPIPALTSLPATSTATTFAPRPISGSQNQGLQDLVGFTTASPAPSVGSQASASIAKPLQPTGYQPAQPNYFTSIPLGSSTNSTVPPSSGSLSRTNTGASTPTSTTASGPKKAGDAFGNIWNTASLGAGIKKPATPTGPQTSMAAMQKEKASAGIWGATAAPGNNKPAGNQSSSSSAFDLL